MNNKHLQPITAADIVERLPLHRSLNESQTALVALAPYWHRWINDAVAQGKLSAACAKSTQLVAWQRDRQHERSGKLTNSGKLIISCNNPSNATLIKQNKQSIIEHLNQAVGNEPHSQKPQKSSNLTTSATTKTVIKVQQLVIRLRFDDTPLALTPNADKSSIRNRAKNLSSATFSAIEACENQTNNENLAKSLNNLARTLRASQRLR